MISEPNPQLKKINELIDNALPALIEIRRDLHQHPELGFEEHRTSSIVSDWLEQNDIEVKKGVAKTGVVGLLRGKSEGKTVALRADMDALPITEESGVPYSSITPGKAHSCGHDGHTTILMGTAKILSQLRDTFAGNVKFVFQPAEEGGGGGDVMCQEGVLENPKVDSIFALHDWPDLRVGEVGIQYGPSMASSNRFELTLYGRGGHAARPNLAIDPIVLASKVINDFQTIVSRQVNPLSPAVITIGTINAGNAANVIPESVTMLGTIRSFDENTKNLMMSSMKTIAESHSKMVGASPPKLEFNKGYPVTVNNDDMVDVVAKVSKNIVGENNTKVITEPSMGAEDFSFFLRQIPGAMFRIGIASLDGSPSPALHNPKFNFNDDSIPSGVSMMSGVVLEYLSTSVIDN